MAAVAAVLVIGCTAQATPRPLPAVVTGAAYPASYAVVYDVHERSTELFEVLRVDRPFLSSDLLYRTSGTPGAGAVPVGGSVSTVTALYSISTSGVQLVSGRQAGPPSGDEYLGQEMGDLARRGLARATGQGATRAGRRCQEFRFARPPAGPVPPLAPGDHDDLCIDADGLVLAEAWTYHGQVVETRSAVKVETGEQPIQDPLLPAPPSVAGAAPGGPAAAAVTADPNPGSFIAQPPIPGGFTPAGPWRFRLPDPAQPGQTAAQSSVWAFADGARCVTVEAGSERGGLPWQAGDTVTTPLTLIGLGPATVALRSDGYQIRIDLGDGRWVRLLGTVPLTQLIEYTQLLKLAPA